MSVISDEARVSDLLQRKFPSWANAPKPTSRREDSDVFGPGSETANYDYYEFFLDTNWVLHPKALSQFFEEMEKSTVKHEITFDPKAGTIKIRCPRDQEEAMMVFAGNAMERIVNPDSNAEVALNTIEAWNESHLTPEELRELEFSRAPHPILESRCKSKWDIPKDGALDQFTIHDLLPGSSLSTLQKSTGAVLRLYNCGLATWIGADSEDKISLVKKKLNTLVKYFGCQHAQKRGHFFNSEEVRGWTGEFRYLSNVNSYILPSFFLDRIRHKSSDYSKLFSKGATIRISSRSLQPGTYTLAPQNRIIPATSGKNTEEPFKAFQSVEYRGKALQRTIPETDSSTPIFLGQPDFPDITSWVDHLPNSQPMAKVNAYQQSADESGRDTDARNIPVSHDKTDVHGPNGNQPTATANINGVLGTLADKATPEMEGFGTDERLLELESQMVALTQETSDTQSTDIHQDSTINAQSGQELRDSSEISELSSDPAPLPKLGLNKPVDCSEDPFLGLYLGVRSTFAPKKSLVQDSHVNPATIDMPSSSSTINDECLINLEEPTFQGENREFHNTMFQQAGFKATAVKRRSTRSVTTSTAVGRGNPTTANLPESSKLPKVSTKKYLDPELLSNMNRALTEVLDPLRMCTGILSVKAQIGRFCLTRINQKLIPSNPDSDVRYQEPSKLKKRLDLNSIHPKALWFTEILTTHGGDANYISELKEPDGTRMWSHDSNGRRSIYEFLCEATTIDGHIFYLILKVDTTDFSHHIRLVDQRQDLLFVHCVKRSWDFQLEVSKTHNLDKGYENFAKDLVNSLCVIPQKSGPPHLEFSTQRGYQVGVLTVRIRNTATCTRQKTALSVPQTNDARSTVLDISEIHDMELKVEDPGQGPIKYYAEAFPGNPSNGNPPMWFEASIQSKAIISAFKENENLELGDETTWSPETLCNAGVFEDLVTAASDTVKQMDGVGYWCNNHQDPLNPGGCLGNARGAKQERLPPGAYREIFW